MIFIVCLVYAFTSNILRFLDTLVLDNAVDNSQNWLYTIRLFKIKISYILNVMHIKVPIRVCYAGGFIVSWRCRPSSIGMIVWCPISELDILTSLSILALRVSGDVLLSLLGDLCVYLLRLLDSRSHAPLAVPFMCFSYSQRVYCVYPLSRSSQLSKLFGFLPSLRNIDRGILTLANAWRLHELSIKQHRLCL